MAELHLGRTEEAQAALDQALKKEPGYAEAIANLLVLTVITGKDPKEFTRYDFLYSSHIIVLGMLTVHLFSTLQKAAPQHPFLVDLEEKSALFDKAATKYSAKVSA